MLQYKHQFYNSMKSLSEIMDRSYIILSCSVLVFDLLTIVNFHCIEGPHDYRLALLFVGNA